MHKLDAHNGDTTRLSKVPAPIRTGRSWFQRIFAGADGLRAVWALALYFALITLLEFLVKAIFKHLHRLDPDQLRHIAKYPTDLLITNGIPFAVVAIVILLMSRIERRSLGAYGIGPTSDGLRQFAAGIFWGAALLSLLIALLCTRHLLVFDGFLLSGLSILRYAAEWAIGFLCVALFEEAVSRGFIQFTLARGIAGPLRYTPLAPYAQAIGFWVVAAFLSWLFGSGHSGNAGESPIGLISAGLLGAVFSLSLWRTGSLWWAIGFHASWDWAQSFLYGVADSGHMVAFHLLQSHPQGAPLYSGGLTGPEGSIYMLPILALSVVVVLLTQRKRNWPAPGSNLASEREPAKSPDTNPPRDFTMPR